MKQLIDEAGQPAYGIFQQPPERINFRDYDLRSPMDRRLGKYARWRRFHQFQFFGLISDDLIGGCALADLSLVSIAFIYLYQPSTGRMIERRFKWPLGLSTEVSQQPEQGSWSFRQRANLMRMSSDAERREKRLLVELADGTRIDACFSESDPVFQPMCICTPVARDGWVYAQKVAGVRCRGEVSCEFGTFDLAAIDAFAHHDWSAGYMRRETVWRWACLSAMVEGRRLGLNLSCGVNETGFTENCFWLDGVLHKVDTVAFRFDHDDVLKPWHITSFDRQVDLWFEAAGLHQERLDLGMLASNFKQVFGRFHGEIRPEGQPVIAIDGQWGFVEDQYAKW